MSLIDDTNIPTKKQRLTVLDAFISSKNDDFKLCRLTYISKPTRALSEEEKQGLLAGAKKRNSDMNITGILFLAEDLYMQTLEGPRVALLDLLQRINRDGRHNQLTVTSIEYIESRIYPRWSMERVVLSEDSLFIMNNLFNTIVSSFDVLRTYSQQSVIMDWLTNEMKPKPTVPEETKKDQPIVEEIVLVCNITSPGLDYTEELEPRQYVSFVNRYVKTCSDIITGFRGQFARYAGDSVIGVFGNEYIENAIEASIEIQRVLNQTREKAASDATNPEQVLFCSIGITVGEFRPISEEPNVVFRTQQEKNFMDFFGTGAVKAPKSVFGSSRTPGYEIYEGGAFDIACKIRRATSFYRIPVLLSEKARMLYVNTRKKALGMQPYPEQKDFTPVQTQLKPGQPSPGPSSGSSFSSEDNLMSSFFLNPFVPPSTPALSPFPAASGKKNPEVDISLVGTVRTDDATNMNVYAPTQFLNDSEPFRTATDRIADWKKTVEHLRYNSL